jgi:hypothetical protein
MVCKASEAAISALPDANTILFCKRNSEMFDGAS